EAVSSRCYCSSSCTSTAKNSRSSRACYPRSWGLRWASSRGSSRSRSRCCEHSDSGSPPTRNAARIEDPCSDGEKVDESRERQETEEVKRSRGLEIAGSPERCREAPSGEGSEGPAEQLEPEDEAERRPLEPSVARLGNEGEERRICDEHGGAERPEKPQADVADHLNVVPVWTFSRPGRGAMIPDEPESEGYRAQVDASPQEKRNLPPERDRDDRGRCHP